MSMIIAIRRQNRKMKIIVYLTKQILISKKNYIRNEYKHKHKKMEQKEENRNELNGDYKLPDKN